MTDPWTPPGPDLPAAPPPPPAPPPQPGGYAPFPAYGATPYGTPAYPGGPHPAGIPPSKTMASWALGLTILGCLVLSWAVGVGLAITVLVQARHDPRDRGQKRAVAALVIAGLWAAFLGVSAVAGFVNSDDRSPFVSAPSPLPSDDEDTIIDSQSGEELPKVAPAELVVGDCFDDTTLAGAGDEDVRSDLVTLIPCERQHDFEAYHLFELAGSEFPGLREVRRRVTTGCARSYEQYVGKPIGQGGLEYWAYFPTGQAWTFGDHGVTCVVGLPRHKVSGSLHHASG